MESLNDTSDMPTGAWTPGQRFAFRMVFAYFAIFGAGSLLDVGAAPRRLLAALHEPLVGWFGHVVLRLSGTPNDGGVRWAVAQQIVALSIAVAIAGVWSLLSRRAEYRRLHGWMRLVLRYYVAVIMMIYGGLKVIPVQFPPISLEQLTQPLGSLAPMGLLWNFMGFSAVYTMFAGLGESIGAFLLFFRRTTTAGALVLVAVLSNVALLNYAYDVPVKQLSTNLLLAAIVLIAPDTRRLIDVLLLNRASRPVDLAFRLPAWLRKTRPILKPVIVVGATCVPLVVAAMVSPRLRASPPLYGVYDVTGFARNGTVVSPLATDSTRWKRVVFGRGRTMTVESMTGATRVYLAAVDSNSRRVTVSFPATPRLTRVLEYERLATGALRVRGMTDGDSIDVTLEPVDLAKRYRLLGARPVR